MKGLGCNFTPLLVCLSISVTGYLGWGPLPWLPLGKTAVGSRREEDNARKIKRIRKKKQPMVYNWGLGWGDARVHKLQGVSWTVRNSEELSWRGRRALRRINKMLASYVDDEERDLKLHVSHVFSHLSPTAALFIYLTWTGFPFFPPQSTYHFCSPHFVFDFCLLLHTVLPAFPLFSNLLNGIYLIRENYHQINIQNTPYGSCHSFNKLHNTYMI